MRISDWSSDVCSSDLLLLKAFYPARPPIPMQHVDTTWKFREMIAFRDQRAAKTGVELRTWRNPDGLAHGVGPISHGRSDERRVRKECASPCRSRWSPH